MSVTTPESGTRTRQRSAAGTATEQGDALTRPDAFQLADGKTKPDTSTAPRTKESDTSLVEQHRRLDLADVLKKLKAEQVVFKKLELREGIVVSIDKDWFRVRLVDPEDEHPDEEVDIFMDQVSTPDLGLVAPGALFFWAIGYVTRRGTRELVCRVTFRRRPVATRRRRRQSRAFADAALDDLT